MPVSAVRGFKDILPEESGAWDAVERKARGVFASFGFSEIRPPILEKTELFSRGIGQHTDIVEKEMYAFTDKSGESVCLRPEATGGVLRAVIEHGLHKQAHVLKLFTIGPMFRHERPQKGRLRQFHQMNAELVGTHAPAADADIISLAWEILGGFGIRDLRLEVNSLGCPACRPRHREDLLRYLGGVGEALCPDCRRRCATNPLRVFDCKNESCRAVMERAPAIGEYLCDSCASHHDKVLVNLNSLGIPFVHNQALVRGLDYYVRTTFEIVSSRLGAQGTVAAGGRYDGLIAAMEGPDLPGVGMAVGFERLLLLLDEGKEAARGCDIFIAAMDEAARTVSLPWAGRLRRLGYRVQMPYEDAGLKALMKQADRLSARFALILGESEIERQEAVLRDMTTRGQQAVPFSGIVESLRDIMVDQTAKKS